MEAAVVVAVVDDMGRDAPYVALLWLTTYSCIDAMMVLEAFFALQTQYSLAYRPVSHRFEKPTISISIVLATKLALGDGRSRNMHRHDAHGVAKPWLGYLPGLRLASSGCAYVIHGVGTPSDPAIHTPS